MKTNFILILICLTTSGVFAQHYEPQILILAPNETIYDNKLEKELSQINDGLKKSSANAEQQQYIQTKEFNAQPENIRLMILSEFSFSKNKDFFRQTSHIAYQYLVHRFYERFTNLLILLSDQKSKGELNDLNAIASKEKVQYILNFPRIELYRSDGIVHAKIRVQLYDNLTGKYPIDRDFDGDWGNPGFEFACKDKTLHCTINNALSTALAEVIQIITSDSPTLKRERQLVQQRYDELMANHFSKPCEVAPLKTIIRENSDLPLDNIFQVLYDDQKTKFVAFSVEQVSAQDFKRLKDNKRDKNVKVISGKDIKDKGFLDNIPRTYAFIIKGVKYNGKWYYEKDHVTYFEAATLDEGRRTYFNNLQKWNFFIDNTAMASPNFWETGLFEKVRDLKQDPDWKKYGESIWKTEEANNRSYIGMYEIVASVIRKTKSVEDNEFEKTIKENKLKPAYEQLKRKDPKAYSKYTDHSLIYPNDRSVVINPVLLTDDRGIKTIHYFVVLANSNDIFEWTYFPSEEVKGDQSFGGNVVDRMSTITDWTFSHDNLNDKNFWENFVLVKDGDKFKYLKRITL